MNDRELFETLYARQRASATGHPCTADDVAAGRDGGTYHDPVTAGAYRWFGLGRDCVVAVLPTDHGPTTSDWEAVHDEVVQMVSESLFKQGINNVRSY